MRLKIVATDGMGKGRMMSWTLCAPLGGQAGRTAVNRLQFRSVVARDHLQLK